MTIIIGFILLVAVCAVLDCGGGQEPPSMW